MIHRVVEGQIGWLPGISLADLPNNLPKGIRTFVHNGVLGIEAQSLVGALPLQNGDTLQISPKIGQVNFLKLLSRARGLDENFEKSLDDAVEYGEDDEPTIDYIVARQLFRSAGKILRLSPLTGRVREHQRSTFAKGRISAVETARNLVCRERSPIEYDVSVRTTDIPENRLIGSALTIAWGMLTDAGRAEFLDVYFKWHGRLPKSRDQLGDMAIVDERMASKGYGGPRDYYTQCLTLAKIVLGASGIGFEESSVVCGDSLLINSADVFERYVRAVIRSAVSPAGYVVTKGSNSVSLYTDGTFDLQPDILVSKSMKYVLVGDAKYKEATPGDHYQIASYLTGFNASRGLLISPTYGEEAEAVQEYKDHQGRYVFELLIPLSNLPRTEELLSQAVQKFGSP